MEHRFVSAAGDEGVWSLQGDREFCRWWWHEDSRTLHVRCGSKSHDLAVPPLDHRADGGIRLDLPETARDVARHLERLS